MAPHVRHAETVGRPSLLVLFLVFAASGFSGLIDEPLWTHYLKLMLGHAAYAQIAGAGHLHGRAEQAPVAIGNSPVTRDLEIPLHTAPDARSTIRLDSTSAP